jgi:NDP-sugar pyrophosphorylase family protein
MPVMVLSAGLGTRLRPLSTWIAKPLAPVGDRPALAHVLDRVRAFGGPVLVNAHHHADQLRAFLEREAPNVLISEEKELLDTAGGVRRALEVLAHAPPSLLARRGAGGVEFPASGKAGASAGAGASASAGPSASEPLLVWNGDTLLTLDLPALRTAHSLTPGPTGATLVVRPSATPDGNVGLDATGRVVRIRREAVLPGEVRAADFLGIQVLGSELYARLPERGGLIEGFYLPLMAEGVLVRAWETDAPFHDIGTLATYLEANLAWLEERGVGSFVAEGASVAPGVTLVESIVGRGASVEGQGALSRCVVWPDAHAVAPLEGAIVTPFGVVH